MAGIITIIIAIALFVVYAKYSKYSEFRNPKINIELIPFEAHGFNVRSRLTPTQWEKICKVIHRKTAKGSLRCQQCGETGHRQGFKHPVECHEVWHFDDRRQMQKLIGLVSICPLCHKAKHIGLAKRMGYAEQAKQHMAKHNRWSNEKVEAYIAWTKAEVKKRSGKNYRLDLTYLNRKEFGFLQTHFTDDEQGNCDEKLKY